MAANPSSSLPDRPSLRPPQFGLRTLLALIAACAALLALLQWLHPAAVLLLGFLLVSIFCHVAGNAIGTRLRQIGDSCDQMAAEPRIVVTPQSHDFAPATPLSRRQSLGWMIIVATSVGMTSGAVGGGLWTFASSHGQAGLPDIAVGILAFAFLGGMATFAVFSFAQVLLGAVWQALSCSSPAVADAQKANSASAARYPEASAP